LNIDGHYKVIQPHGGRIAAQVSSQRSSVHVCVK
jgi:hypothetical protein